METSRRRDRVGKGRASGYICPFQRSFAHYGLLPSHVNDCQRPLRKLFFPKLPSVGPANSGMALSRPISPAPPQLRENNAPWSHHAVTMLVGDCLHHGQLSSDLQQVSAGTEVVNLQLRLGASAECSSRPRPLLACKHGLGGAQCRIRRVLVGETSSCVPAETAGWVRLQARGRLAQQKNHPPFPRTKGQQSASYTTPWLSSCLLA